MKSETIKVLLIDDDEDDYILTRELLSEVKVGKYLLDWAPSYEEGLEVAGRREHHVCLVDYRIGERSGVQLIREARESRLTTPMILFTGSSDHDYDHNLDIEAMQAGATDYLVKGETPPARLERTIRYAVELNTERCRAEEELGVYAQKRAVVAEIGRLALTGGELKDLFDEAVSLVARTLGVEYCKVLELLPEGDALILGAGVGWKEEYPVGQATVSAGTESQAGFTLLSAEPVVVEDLRTETRFSGSPLLHEHGVVSGISVIIRGRERPYGVLGAHTASVRRFTTDDVSFLNAVANVLAEAIGRKRAEDELRQSEARFRRVVESNMLGIFSWDLSGEITGANDAFLNMVGYTPEDSAAGKMRWTEMTPPEYRKLDEKALAELAASGVCETYEKEYIRKDGSRISILLGCATFEGGKHSGVAFVLDISDRKSAVDQLRHAKDFSENLIQTANVIILGLDVAGNIGIFNQAAEKITGYTAAELKGSSWFEKLVPKDRYPYAWEEFNRLIEGGMPKTFENPILTKSGEERYIIWQNNQVRVDGEVVATISFGNDITERGRAEAELRFKTSLLESQTEASIDGILVVSNDGRILSFNKRFVELWNVPESVLETRSEQSALPWVLERLDNPREFLERVDYLYNHPQGESDDEIQLKDGRTFECHSAPVKSEEDEYYGRVWFFRDITARKRAEEEKAQLTAQIESQRQRLNNIVASVPGVVWEAWGEPDAATQRINFVSDYIETMLGYSVEECLSKPNFWLSIVHKDDRERTALTAAADFAGGKGSSLEFRWVAKDGRVLWVESNSAITADNEGRPVGLRGVTIDITERKNVEERLRESEAHYRLLFASNPLPMWVYDLETLFFLAVNDAAILYYGYSREEFLSMNIKDIRPREDIADLLENVSRVSAGIDRAGTWRHRKKDGQMIDMEISSHELVFAGRRAELVLANDVTERLRIQEIQARRAAQVVLRADIIASLAERDSSLQVILKHCAEALVLHLDAAFARIWTLNKEENVLELQASAGMYTHIDGPHARVPVGTLKIGLIAEERQPHITNEVQSDPRVSDKEWASREGMVAFAGYPLLVEDRLVGVMALFARHKLAEDTVDALASVADNISQDIERKRVEEALRASEEQLRQSQRLESVGMLAGGIAHDFNNLLTVITGYSELTLNRLDMADPLARNVEEIKKAAERATSLTRQLLAFSRKQVLQPKVLNLNSVILNIQKMLGRLVGEDMELRTSLGAGLGHVKADPGQIEQVVLNLVVNARDAMPQGGKVTLETANVYLDERYARKHIAVLPGWYVMLAITDTGHGMDAETLKHIFEPFFTTKEQGKGTGLGLSTVYGIVKQSGGNIWVYSEVGVGTSFKIYLPLVDEKVTESPADDSRPGSAAGTETILLAEDDEMVRNLARESLKMHGYTVLEAANAGEALLICHQHEGPIHLLLTDVVMPRMSGKELAEQLVRLRPDTGILYMSGYADQAIVHHGILDGDIAFIGKPFTPDALVLKVIEVLQQNLKVQSVS